MQKRDYTVVSDVIHAMSDAIDSGEERATMLHRWKVAIVSVPNVISWLGIVLMFVGSLLCGVRYEPNED